MTVNLGSAAGTISLDAAPFVNALSTAQKAIGTFEQSAAGMGGTVEKAASGMGGALKGIVGGLGQIGLAAMGVRAVADSMAGLAGAMVAGNAQFERYETQFTVLLG